MGPRNGRPRSPESHGHRGSEPVGAGLPGCGAAAPSVPGPRFSPVRRALLSFLAQGFVSSAAGWGPDPGPLSPLRSSGPWPHIRLILILARASPSGYLFFLPSTRCFSLPPHRPGAPCLKYFVLFTSGSLNVFDSILSVGVLFIDRSKVPQPLGQMKPLK